MLRFLRFATPLSSRAREGLHAGRRNPTACRRTGVLRGLAAQRFAWLAVALVAVRLVVFRIVWPRIRIRGAGRVAGVAVLRARDGCTVLGVPLDRAARERLGAGKRLR